MVDSVPHAGVDEPGFAVSVQRVHLDIDFKQRKLRGRTDMIIQPLSKDLRTLKFNCRQCKIRRALVQGKSVGAVYHDPYQKLVTHLSMGVHQHHLLSKRIEGSLKNPPNEELVIQLPKSVRIEELDPLTANANDLAMPAYLDFLTMRQEGEDAKNVTDLPAGKLEADKTYYKPITVTIEYEVQDPRDGFHFVGTDEGDRRYPHAYSNASEIVPSACNIMPCRDHPLARSAWEVSVRCPRTVADVYAQGSTSSNQVRSDGVNGVTDKTYAPTELSEEDRGLEMIVVCSGKLKGEIVDPVNPSMKTVTYTSHTPFAPCHLGIAVGPFEYVDLSEYRERDEDEKLGENAISIHAYCLPGRSQELKNSALFMPKAMDHFVMTYGPFPFAGYSLCFVDDVRQDVLHKGSLSICSSRLLYPDDIIDPIDTVTRTLVHALAYQYLGVSIVPRETNDIWIIVGCSYFMTEIFLESLLGKNHYRHQQKLNADKVVALDVRRPSLYDLGPAIALHPSELEFMILKAPLVLFILHRRLSTKAASKLGVNRIIWRLCLNTKTGDLLNGAVSTPYFLRVAEKAAHGKLDVFFSQWIYGAGCPHFVTTQRFNKKKLVVEMLIKQVQADALDDTARPENFLRDVREAHEEVEPGPLQTLFTGPMTIRIHEADGTPYEHVVDVNEASKKVEIPYNTKYKRLKRSRRQKERAAAAAGLDISGDAQDDVLFYCLGDVLQTEEEVTSWRLSDWSKDDEDRMNQESYEWIRIDAEFEWIAKISSAMPHYMFVSQLQQDKDVVAQLESVHYLSSQKPHPLISTILIRTLMDKRYFHGVRTAAAMALSSCATSELDWVGLYHLEKAYHDFFCFPGSSMTRSNDFSDRTSYIIQCIIPKAMTSIRDHNGRVPSQVKTFLLATLKFNDNSSNSFSDCFFVSNLLECLAKSMTLSGHDGGPVTDILPPNSAIDLGDLSTAPGQQFQSVNGYEEDINDIIDSQKAVVNIVDRYGRVDEWIPSFHNIYTVTYLECMKVLSQRMIIQRKYTNFLQCARAHNSDYVRLKAFDCLVDMDGLKNDSILRYMLYTFQTDTSPYVRDGLFSIFFKGIGRLALGLSMADHQSTRIANPDSGLVIERLDTRETNSLTSLRNNSLEALLATLDKEITDNQLLKTALGEVLRSNLLSLKEYSDILELCALQYDPITSLQITLKYPRYWKVAHLGTGKLKFTQTSKVRTTPIRRPETASDASGAKPQPSLTALRQAGPANVPAQGQASASAPGSAKAGSKSLTINPAKSGRTILKLSVKNLAAIPQPSTPRSTITLKTGASARPASAVSAAPTPIARAHPPVESKGPKIKLRLGSLGDKSSAGKPPLSSSHVNKNQ